MDTEKIKMMVKEELQKLIDEDRHKEVVIDPEEIPLLLQVLRWGKNNKAVDHRIIKKLENASSHQPVRLKIEEPKASGIASIIHDYIHDYQFSDLSYGEQEKLESVGIKFDWMRF